MPPFQFVIPSLPKPVYDMLKTLRQEFGTTQRGVIAAAIILMHDAFQSGQTEAIRARITAAREMDM